MSINQEQENQINATIAVIAIKLKALKATLNSEELEKYNQIIELEKQVHLPVWEKILTSSDYHDLKKQLQS